MNESKSNGWAKETQQSKEKAIHFEGLLFPHHPAIKAGETVAFGITEWIMVFSQATAVERFAFNYSLPLLSSCPPSADAVSNHYLRGRKRVGSHLHCLGAIPNRHRHTCSHTNTQMDCSASCPPASLNNHRHRPNTPVAISTADDCVYIFLPCTWSVSIK